MKQLPKEFFKNYHHDMTPDINIDKLRDHLAVTMNNQASVNKQTSNFFRFGKSFLVVLLLLLGILGGLFIYSNNQRAYSNDDTKEIHDYLQDNFTYYDEVPFLIEQQLVDDLQIFFYHAKKEETPFIVVFAKSNNLYNLQLFDNNNVIVELDTKTIKINNFEKTNASLELELIVTTAQKQYKKIIIID